MTARLRVIGAADVRRALEYPDCVVAVEQAMRALSTGGAVLPLRQVMPLPSGRGMFGMMPGSLADPECYGIKLLSLFPGNPAHGHSSHLGLHLLFEPEHGRPVALIEASALTAIRTAAASVVATRALARADSSTLAILGTGEQARAHLECFQSVRPFDRVVVWGRRSEAATALAARAHELGCDSVSVAGSVGEAVAGADVVCTLTAASSAILRSADLRPGVHLCLVGSSVAATREVDDQCVARARFFVDQRAAAMEQAGELLGAIAAGAVSRDHVLGEIGEVLSGAVAGRIDDTDVTLYKSLGVAAQDLAAATLVLGRAESLGLGTTVEL